jgi:hypothetical protein
MRCVDAFRASPAIRAVRGDKLSRVGSEQEDCDVCTALIDDRPKEISGGKIDRKTVTLAGAKRPLDDGSLRQRLGIGSR